MRYLEDSLGKSHNAPSAGIERSCFGALLTAGFVPLDLLAKKLSAIYYDVKVSEEEHDQPRINVDIGEIRNRACAGYCSLEAETRWVQGSLRS